MSHLTQMAGLAVHNFVSAACGAAVARGAHPGARPAPVEHARELLGRPRPHHHPRAAAALVRRRHRAGQPGRGAELPLAPDRADRRGRDAVDPRWARSPARRRSRTSARTAAGRTTPTRRHPFENPEPDHATSSILWTHPGHPVRVHVRLREDGQGPEAGLGRVRRDVRAVARRRADRHAARSPAATPSSTAVGGDAVGHRDQPAATWKARKPASVPSAAACSPTPRPAPRPGAVNCQHDSMTPLGGAVPLVNIMLGEVSPGGTGSGLYGMLVFALTSRVHRRPHGRAHAGVPRQEDPGGGDEARRALPPVGARRDPGFTGASVRARDSASRRWPTTARTACRR